MIIGRRIFLFISNSFAATKIARAFDKQGPFRRMKEKEKKIIKDVEKLEILSIFAVLLEGTLWESWVITKRFVL
jgi:hypothetical protein